MDTIEQALENFKRLGFENIERNPKEEMGIVYPFRSMINEKDLCEVVTAEKMILSNPDCPSCFVNGYFLASDSIYNLNMKPIYSTEIDLNCLTLLVVNTSKKDNCSNVQSKIERERTELDNHIQRFARLRFEEIKENLKMDPEMVVYPDSRTVQIKVGFFLNGQNVFEMWDKLTEAVASFYT